MDGCRLSVSRISQGSIGQGLGATNAISFRSWTDCTHRSLASTQNACRFRSPRRQRREKVGGMEAALAALAAVGTIEGPEVSMLTACCFQKARWFSTRTTNRCAVEPAGVFRREGEEAFDCPRGSSPATRPRVGGERSPSSTNPGCGSSGSTPPTPLPEVGNPGGVSPTQGEPASGEVPWSAKGKRQTVSPLQAQRIRSSRCPPRRRCSSTIAFRILSQTCKMPRLLGTSRKLLE